MPILAKPDMRFVDTSRSDIPASTEKWRDLLEHGASHFLFQTQYDGLILDFFYRLCVESFDNNKSLDVPMLRFVESIIGELAENPFNVQMRN
jgi:hypothetical protein